MDEQRHYPIILQGLKHRGVMKTPENVVVIDYFQPILLICDSGRLMWILEG
jgi:hypothetical protein